MIPEYFLMGVLTTIIFKFGSFGNESLHSCTRGNILSLGFSGISFLTKSIGMIFFTWLGIEIIGLDYRIYVPILTFVWFFSHLCEAFVIQHYMEKNVPKWLQDLQIK